ncbi:NADP-dependent 3-hydroxy acid dehydrogenase YdfG (EC @ 3-hydroxypropionate dehydrogenase (EC [Olavius algarvensis associated proteobacterium Delta 3]|nr:NADP-dependent 3-hydroxy acid dehydrogenase YdfG (EC @ 3-hydroxypropionate dehydrogenase (EC [Olavius algarvensis associated proteobacterium Delta 3]
MKGTAFITGATSGFGRACAELFAQDGWNLVLAARRTDRLADVKERLEGDIAIHTITLDVRDRQAVKAAVADLPAQFSDVNILLNNAGLALGLAPAHKVDLDDWETMVDTNIKGMMYCTHAVLPAMVERNRGHIFNIGSVAGDWPYPNGNVYCATKAFVKQFSLTLRTDLVGTRVRVTNIEPGLAETEFSLVRFKGDHDTAGNVYDNTQPLTAKDIADIIFWAAGLPPHVNINRIEVMPVCQALGPMVIDRKQ